MIVPLLKGSLYIIVLLFTTKFNPASHIRHKSRLLSISLLSFPLSLSARASQRIQSRREPLRWGHEVKPQSSAERTRGDNYRRRQWTNSTIKTLHIKIHQYLPIFKQQMDPIWRNFEFPGQKLLQSVHGFLGRNTHFHTSSGGRTDNNFHPFHFATVPCTLIVWLFSLILSATPTVHSVAKGALSFHARASRRLFVVFFSPCIRVFVCIRRRLSPFLYCSGNCRLNS